MPADKESWMIYAKGEGVSESKAKEYWKKAKESIKNKKEEDYTDSDWRKAMGIYKAIINNSKSSKKEKEEKKVDEKDIAPFIAYAKKNGVDNEKQAKAIFFQVRGALAKKEDQDPEKFGPKQMGILWGEFKDAIEKASKDGDGKKKESTIVTSDYHNIEGFLLKPNALIKIREAFSSGSASSVVQKLGGILGRKIGMSITFADIPLEYKNSYGTFAGFLGSVSNGMFIKINFLLSGSDSIESYDIYLDGYDNAPTYTVDTRGFNIIQVVNSITENLIDDGEVNDGALQERDMPTTPESVATIIDRMVSEDKSILASLQKDSMADLFNGIWDDFVKDKPNYRSIKYYLFAKGVKTYLLQRGMTNKTFKPRKKGSKEAQIKDPALAAQFEEVVETIEWKEKFDFLDGVLAEVYKGYVQSVYVYGSPGSGKSYQVVNTLDKLGADYKVYKGGVKGIDELIRILYNNREDTIMVFDDFDSVLKQKDSANIFKAILENKPVRTLTYVDTSRGKNKAMSDIPQKFDFTSAIVFISNSPKLDSAVASRSIVLEISLSNEDMVAKMKSTLSEYRPDIDMSIKLKALEYMQEISEGVAGLDYRMMDNIIIAMKVNPSGWKKMALWMMNSVA